MRAVRERCFEDNVAKRRTLVIGGYRHFYTGEPPMRNSATRTLSESGTELIAGFEGLRRFNRQP
jgi:hypothetical protein